MTIMPHRHRANNSPKRYRMGTNGEINLFEKAEYHSLAKMFETDEQ